MPTFQTIAILSYFWWLQSTFNIRIKVSTTHAFIILAISIIFKISSSHFPCDVNSLSQIGIVVSLFDDITINLHTDSGRSYIF